MAGRLLTITAAMALAIAESTTLGAAASVPVSHEWVRGTHFNVLEQPVSVPPNAASADVVEVFWYSCPHCYRFEPLLERWSSENLSRASVRRVPATWSTLHQGDARLFYALKLLGREDLHRAVYDQINRLHRPLTASNLTETFRLQSQFAAEHGIGPLEFKSAFYSKSIEKDLAEAGRLSEAYRLVGVPYIVINGRCTADLNTAGSERRLLELMSFLIKQCPAAKRG